MITWGQIAGLYSVRAAARQRVDTARTAVADARDQLDRLLLPQFPPPNMWLVQAARAALAQATAALQASNTNLGGTEQQYETAMSALSGQLDATVPCLLLPLLRMKGRRESMLVRRVDVISPQHAQASCAAAERPTITSTYLH